jgi:hypothetical protein
VELEQPALGRPVAAQLVARPVHRAVNEPVATRPFSVAADSPEFPRHEPSVPCARDVRTKRRLNEPGHLASRHHTEL